MNPQLMAALQQILSGGGAGQAQGPIQGMQPQRPQQPQGAQVQGQTDPQQAMILQMIMQYLSQAGQQGLTATPQSPQAQMMNGQQGGGMSQALSQMLQQGQRQ